jgi:hypothetical protein
MPTLPARGAQRRTKALDEDAHLERRRHRGDLAILVGSLLAVFAVIAGAAFFAWDLSTDNEQVANATPQIVAPVR